MKHILLLASGIVFISCNMQGVRDETVEVDETIHDSILNIRQADTIGSKTDLLEDSINGAPNQMVLQKENGLRIEWEVKSQKNKISPDDVLLINYHSRVAGGELYDSNDAVGKPVPVKTGIGMMIKGMEEGLLEMHPGDKGRIMIPNALAYGEDGYLTVVPPKADIIVDIEITDRIKPIELEDGVRVYKWQTNDAGSVPAKNQEITFDYFAYSEGKKGKLYDNSFQNGEPFKMKFQNDNVVEGLHIGMSVMKAGENAMIHIPSKLAYGGKGLIDHVPANTDILYDVRVIAIK